MENSVSLKKAVEVAFALEALTRADALLGFQPAAWDLHQEREISQSIQQFILFYGRSATENRYIVSDLNLVALANALQEFDVTFGRTRPLEGECEYTNEQKYGTRNHEINGKRHSSIVLMEAVYPVIEELQKYLRNLA